MSPAKRNLEKGKPPGIKLSNCLVSKSEKNWAHIHFSNVISVKAKKPEKGELPGVKPSCQQFSRLFFNEIFVEVFKFLMSLVSPMSPAKEG